MSSIEVKPLSLASKILAGTSLILLGTVAHGATRFLLNVVAGRSLGPSDFGHLTLCIAIAQFAALLWPTTLGAATTRFVAAAGTPETAQGMLNYLRKAALLSGLATGAVAAAAWTFLGDGGLVPTLVTSFVCLMYGQYHFTRGSFLGGQQFKRAAGAEFVLAALTLSVTLIVSLTVNTGVAFACALGLGFFGYSLSYRRFALTATRLVKPARKEILHYILIGTIGTIASSGFLQMSVVAVSHWGTVEDVGLYGAALATATPAAVLATALGSALLPSLASANARGDTGVLRTVTDQAVRGINILAVAIFGTLVIFADRVTLFLWSDDFADSTSILRILLVAVMISSCVVPCITRLSATSTKALESATRISIFGVIAAAVFWVVIGDTFGVVGIAWGYLAGATSTSLALFMVCWHIDGQRWAWLFVRWLSAVLALALFVWASPSLDFYEGLILTLLSVGAYAAPEARNLRNAFLRRRASAAR